MAQPEIVDHLVRKHCLSMKQNVQLLLLIIEAAAATSTIPVTEYDEEPDSYYTPSGASRSDFEMRLKKSMETADRPVILAFKEYLEAQIAALK